MHRFFFKQKSVSVEELSVDSWSWKFDVLITNICPRNEASRAIMLVLSRETSNFQDASIRPIVPRQKHSVDFIVYH